MCMLGAGMVLTPSIAMASHTKSNGTRVMSIPDNKVVKGNVADASGPLIGATVKVAGTNNGTVTDFEGNFSIQCPSDATL